MQTGQNVHDPLTQLNSHMGFGAMAGLNPFGEMGLNPNDPNMVRASFFGPPDWRRFVFLSLTTQVLIHC